MNIKSEPKDELAARRDARARANRATPPALGRAYDPVIDDPIEESTHAPIFPPWQADAPLVGDVDLLPELAIHVPGAPGQRPENIAPSAAAESPLERGPRPIRTLGSWGNRPLGLGSIQEHHPTCFGVTYSDRGVQRCVGTFPTRKEAEAARTAVYEARKAGLPVPVYPRRPRGHSRRREPLITPVLASNEIEKQEQPPEYDRGRRCTACSRPGHRRNKCPGFDAPAVPPSRKTLVRLPVLPPGPPRASGEPRSRTENVSRMKRALQDEGGTADSYPEGIERPRTRGDCAGGARPCPFVSCAHHLYLDVGTDGQSIKLNFPDREVWEMTETCSLDVADRGGATLEEVGVFTNLTRERIRQVETRAIENMRGNELGLAPDR